MFSFSLCKHEWGPLEGRVQYCKHCNQARTVKCPHEWVEEHAFEKSNILDNVIGYMYIMRCKHCGERKKFKIGVSD